MFQMEKLTRLGAVHFKYYFAIFFRKRRGAGYPENQKNYFRQKYSLHFRKKKLWQKILQIGGDTRNMVLETFPN